MDRRKKRKWNMIRILAMLPLVLIPALLLPPRITGGQEAENVCDLVIETVTFGADHPGLQEVEEAVNRIVTPLLGVRIHLLDVAIPQHATQVGQMISNGEPLDLVMAGLTYSLSSMAGDGLLLPLEDLLDQYGGDLKDLFGDKLKAGYVGDILYGVPGRVNSAAAGGIMYNRAMAEQLGITMPDPCTLEDLDSIFARIQEELPGVYPIAFVKRDVSMVNFVYAIESYGNGLYEFGVTFNPWESTEIVNVYASEAYRSYCHKMREWQKAGYFPPNMMTSSALPSERLNRRQIFCLPTGYSPMQNAVQLTDEDFAMVRTTQPLQSTGYVQERMWGIPMSSQHPEKAMEFLNLLYTNQEVSNLLMNGIEDVHYTRVSEHVIAHTEDTGYQRIFTFFGNEQQADQWVPATENTAAEQIAFEESAQTSLTMGYTFDSQPVEAEVDAVNEVILTYSPALECGMLEDVDGALDLFQEELEKAGIDRIIEENRRQLSVWMSEQGH